MAKRATTIESKDPLVGLYRRTDVPVRQHGFDIAIYDPISRRVHILNPVAAALWHQLTPDRTFTQVHEMLALTFANIGRARIGQDLKAVIGKLRRLKLLVPDPRRPRKVTGKRAQVMIPGSTISSFNKGYTKPAVKTYTLVKLNVMVNKAERLQLFCDLLMDKVAEGRAVR